METFIQGGNKMSKAIKHRISLQAGLSILDSDISWSVRNNAPYRYHVDLHHFPTDMLIEQVSDTALSHAKESCMIVREECNNISGRSMIKY